MYVQTFIVNRTLSSYTAEGMNNRMLFENRIDESNRIDGLKSVSNENETIKINSSVRLLCQKYSTLRRNERSSYCEKISVFFS